MIKSQRLAYKNIVKVFVLKNVYSVSLIYKTAMKLCNMLVVAGH